MISDEIREKMKRAVEEEITGYCDDATADKLINAVLPMIVEKCAEMAEGNALQWINGEATTSYGQAYQAGSRGAATVIRSLSPGHDVNS